MSDFSLAVCILFHEKPDQTIECLQSFLAAGCPIVLLNNGTSALARERVIGWCADFPQIRLIEVPENIGVAAGRNRIIRETGEQWLFFVDNDIIVKTGDWYQRLSCHVESGYEVIIPRLLNLHEGRYVDYCRIEVCGSRAKLLLPAGNETNSFPGGAALVNRALFDRLGHYDEAIFVGGEDFELSLRGISTAQPIRALLVDDIELRHDHRPVRDPADARAVLARYDKQLIGNSYDIIRARYGIELDDGWERWVDLQVKAQIPKQVPQEDGGCGMVRGSRPRIALVADIRDWAFSNICTHIRAQLSHKYEFTILYTEDFKGDYDALFRELYQQGFDLVHVFWREVILNLYMHLLRTRPAVSDEMIEAFVTTPLSFSVYDHCLLDDQNLRDYGIVFKYLASGYTVSSERLRAVYEKIDGYPQPDLVIEDGVDLATFNPHNLERLSATDRPLVVGWAGNSRWGKDIDGLDYKGLRTIIVPAIEALRQQGTPIIGRFADRSVEFIPHARMVDYYNSLDVYVCASMIEGTPNPLLEAMACGIPVVSTDVGVVPQLFGEGQRQFILGVRSAAALQEKLALLAGDPALRLRLSAENLATIKGWTRQAEGPKWDRFFSDQLDAPEQQRLLAKRACAEVPYNYALESTVAHFLKDSLSWKITHPLRFLNWHVTRFLNHAVARRRYARDQQAGQK